MIRNLDHPSACGIQANDQPNNVNHVSNGKWQDSDTGVYTKNVVFGDLPGGGRKYLIVHVRSALLGTNIRFSEIYVFEKSSQGLRFFGRLGSSTGDGAGEVNWSHATDIRAVKRQRIISCVTGECHKCADRAVTASFEWNGDGFVRTSLDRKRLTPPNKKLKGVQDVYILSVPNLILSNLPCPSRASACSQRRPQARVELVGPSEFGQGFFVTAPAEQRQS